jgi:hypothetical protein
MTFRPSRVIYPPARFAEDAGGHELSTRRRPVAPAQSDGGPTTATSTPSALSSPGSPLPLYLDDDPVDKTLSPSLPARSTGKRATLVRKPSTSTSSEIVNVDEPAPKKAKPLRPMDTLDDLGMHTDVQVMDLDDASDPREETLNKTNAIADIQAFFTSVNPLPGETKSRMSCNLCA